MNELIRWVKDGVVQPGYVEGATREVVSTSAYAPHPLDQDRARFAELRAKPTLSAPEQIEAIQVMMRLVAV